MLICIWQRTCRTLRDVLRRGFLLWCGIDDSLNDCIVCIGEGGIKISYSLLFCGDTGVVLMMIVIYMTALIFRKAYSHGNSVFVINPSGKY